MTTTKNQLVQIEKQITEMLNDMVKLKSLIIDDQQQITKLYQRINVFETEASTWSMWFDPQFYSTLLDFLMERIYYGKFALSQYVFPNVQKDMSRIPKAVSAIYAMKVFQKPKQMMTSKLIEMEVDKNYHAYILNAAITLFLFGLLLFIYYIFLGFCRLFCPILPPATPEQPAPPVQEKKTGGKKKHSKKPKSEE